MQLHVTRQRLVGLLQDEGRAAHALDTARDYDLGIATAHHPRALQNRLATRTAEAIDRDTGHRDWQTRQQERHPCHIAIVLTRLIGVAQQDLSNRCRIELGVPLNQRAEWNCRQVVNAQATETTTILAKRCAYGIDDEGVHWGSLAIL